MSSVQPVNLRTVSRSPTKVFVIIAFFCSIFLLAGVTLSDVGIIITVCGIQIWVGALIWKRFIIGRSPDLIELAGMGGAVGFALSLLSSQLFRTIIPSSTSWLVLPAIGVLISFKLPSIGEEKIHSDNIFSDHLFIISVTLLAICSLWNWIIPFVIPFTMLVFWYFWIFDLRTTQRVQVIIASLLGAFGALGLLITGRSLFHLEDYRNILWWNLIGATRQYPDTIFNESMVNSVRRFGNTDNIFMAGSKVNYHWLSFAWQATIGSNFVTEPFVITGIASVPILTFVTMCIVWSISRFIFAGQFAPIATIVALSLVGSDSIPFMAPLNIFSSSYTFSLIYVFSLIFIIMNHAVYNIFFKSLLLVMVTAILVGSKASSVPLIVGGLLSLIVFNFAIEKSQVKLKSTYIASSAIGLALSFVYFYRNGPNELSSSFSLSFGALLKQQGPSASGLPIFVGLTVAIVILTIFLYPIFGLLQIDSSIRRDLKCGFIFAIGGGISSLICAFSLSNDLEGTQYFAQVGLAVMLPFSVGSLISRIEIIHRWSFWLLAFIMFFALATSFATWNIYANIEDSSLLYFLKISLVLSIPIFVGLSIVFVVQIMFRSHEFGNFSNVLFFFLLCFSASTSLIDFRNSINRSLEYREIQFDDVDVLSGSADYRELLFWLRQNSADDDLVATNRQCVDSNEKVLLCSGLWSLTSAFSDRQMFVEGIYPHGSSNSERKRRQIIVNDFVNTSSATSRTVLSDYAVRWVVVDYAVTKTRDWGDFAQVRFANKAGAILELAP